MGFLIDTNVLSELRKKQRADKHVASWFQAVDEQDIYLSVLVTGEIRRGIEGLRLRDPSRAATLDVWLEEIEANYSARILPVTRDITQKWGRISTPDPLPVVDGLLAATALVHGHTLVTRNTKDVTRTGVLLVNPFEIRATAQRT